MQKVPHRTRSFAGFTVDLTRGCLLRGTQEIKLPPKPFEALKYLVENPGRLISKSELIQAIWPDTAVTDDSLVQCLMEVRRALGEEAQQIIKTVPRRGYIFDKPVSQTGPTTLTTTYTEETEGVQVVIEEKDTNSPQPQSGPAAHDIDLVPAPKAKSVRRLQSTIKQHRWAAMAVALTVVAAAAIYFAWPREVIDSIAVMPFINVDADSNTEYLSDGLSDSVINNLSEVSELKVSSLNSVLRYKGRQIDPKAVGRELNVRALLIGRLTRHGDEISVSTELIDAKDNHRLWGDQYNYKLADLMALQEKISLDISDALRLRLSGDERIQLTKHHSESREAYEAYLKGRYHNNKRTPEELLESIRYFNRAIELDPKFALPYAGLASSYTTLGARGTISPMEAYPKVIEASMKALMIDDRLAEAHFAQALAKREGWDFVGAEKEFRRAIELNRNYAEAHHAYSHLLIALGRPAESLAESQRLLEIDPLDLQLNAHLGWHYLFTRQYDQAIEKCLRTLKMGENYWAHYYLGQAYEQKGRFDEAISEFKKAIAKSPASIEAKAALGHAYAVSGRRSEAQRIVEELQESSKQHYVAPAHQALIYTGLGEQDKAFEWLQRAAQERSGLLIYLNVDPRYDSLRSDPRFRQLQERVGLAE